MDAHEQRVVQEKAELDVKIESLEAFIAGLRFETVTHQHQYLLRKQLDHMRIYSQILGQRIELFVTEE